MTEKGGNFKENQPFYICVLIVALKGR